MFYRIEHLSMNKTKRILNGTSGGGLGVIDFHYNSYDTSLNPFEFDTRLLQTNFIRTKLNKNSLLLDPIKIFSA